ncbi:stress-induced protein, partial [Saccharothrix sp. ST-888]|uniref:stress-induced protein n=1 Tax=Saccharothrix sp. ST-888 TaxID=1427391 RepID=UPI0005ED3473
GLAGIATDFGVSVEEPGRAAAPAAAAPPKPVVPPAAPGAPTKATLAKGLVHLDKGASVSLEKNGKPFLSSVRIGLASEATRPGRNIDLDACSIAFDPPRQQLETTWFMKRTGC